MNLIPAEMSERRLIAMSGKLQLPASGQNSQGTVTIGIRSEDIRDTSRSRSMRAFMISKIMAW